MHKKRKRQEIENRVILVAEYILKHKATVRATAPAFGVSKSTIHKDITNRLVNISPSLAEEVRKVLDANKEERAIRGGLATKCRYLRMKEGH